MELPKGIRQRGNSLLVDATFKDERRTATIKIADFDTYELAVAEASKKKSDLTYEMKTGKRQPVTESKVWTIGKAFERTLEVKWTKDTSSGQIINGKLAVKFFGKDTKLDKIDLNRIDEWVTELRKGGDATSTVNKKLSALSTMMTVAKDRGGLSIVPTMPREKEKNGRIRFLSDTEEALAIQTLNLWQTLDELDAFVVLIDTGLREKELLKVEGRDVDQRQGVVTAWDTKNGLPRSVPMTKRVKEIMARRLREHPTGRLFPFPRQFMRETWDRLRSHMKLTNDPEFVPYALRHTCCSRLVQRGVDLRRVKEWMGHTTILTTMRYAHLAPKDLLSAVAVLEPGGTPPALKIVESAA